MSSDEYTFENFEMKCGQSVTDSCVGKSVAGDKGFTDASFKKFVGGAVNVFTSGLNVFLSTSTQSFTINMIKGINALRCAVVNAADNAWNFIAAAWWAAFQFNQEGLVEEGLDIAWPYICTCNEDANILATYLGGNEKTASIMSACSEAAQKAGIDNGSA